MRAPDHILTRILFFLNSDNRLVVISHTSNHPSQSWHHLFPGFPQSLPHSSSVHSCPLLSSFKYGSLSDPVRMRCSWLVEDSITSRSSPKKELNVALQWPGTHLPPLLPALSDNDLPRFPRLSSLVPGTFPPQGLSSCCPFPLECSPSSAS